MLRIITKTYSLKSFKRQKFYWYIIGRKVFLHLSIDYYLKYYIYKKIYYENVSARFSNFFLGQRAFIYLNNKLFRNHGRLNTILLKNIHALMKSIARIIYAYHTNAKNILYISQIQLSKIWHNMSIILLLF